MSWGLCVSVLGRFFVVYSLVYGSGIPFLGCDCMPLELLMMGIVMPETC